MKPSDSAKNMNGDFDHFKSFMRRLVAVPHSEIKERLDAEKEAKRTSMRRVSRDSAASSRSRSSQA